MSLSWLTRSSIRFTRMPGRRFEVLPATIADAAFAKPEIYEALEEREVKYAIRIPANDSLQRDIEEVVDSAGGKTQCEAVGGVQGLSLSSSELG